MAECLVSPLENMEQKWDWHIQNKWINKHCETVLSNTDEKFVLQFTDIRNQYSKIYIEMSNYEQLLQLNGKLLSYYVPLS